MCRSVAIGSSAYRIPNTEVKDLHCWSVRYKSQCGERLVRLSFQGQYEKDIVYLFRGKRHGGEGIQEALPYLDRRILGK